MIPRKDMEILLERATPIASLKPEYEEATPKEKWTLAQKIWREAKNQYPAILKGWRFETDKAKTRLGVCKHTRGVVSISKHLLLNGTPEQVFDTTTHEIAHAVLGHGAGHGYQWKRLHKAMGGDGKRCSSEGMGVEHRYLITCPNNCVLARNPETGELFRRIKRHRLTKRMKMSSCGKCREQLLITDTQGE